jgi:dynein light chain roadblock-type
MALTELEDMFKRMNQLPGVHGYLVINSESGLAIRTSFSAEQTSHYVGLLHSFLIKTRSMIRDMDHSNELTFVRLRSLNDEILIAPDKEFTMIFVQKPKL